MAAVADVPQLAEYDSMQEKDGLLTTYLVLCSALCALYMNPNWILRRIRSSQFLLYSSAEFLECCGFAFVLVFRYFDEGLFDHITVCASVFKLASISATASSSSTIILVVNLPSLSMRSLVEAR